MKLMLQLYEMNKTKLWTGYAFYILYVLLMTSPMFGNRWYNLAFGTTIIISFIVANIFDAKNLGATQGKSIFLPISLSQIYFSWLNAKLIVFAVVVLTIYFLTAFIVPMYNSTAETDNHDLLFLLKLGIMVIVSYGIYPDMRKRFFRLGKIFGHLVSMLFVTVFLLFSLIGWFVLPIYFLPELFDYFMLFNWIDIPFIINLLISIAIGKQIFVSKKALLI